MAEKVSVTVPLTAQQKNKIRRATGKTISALKVESTGAAMLKRGIRLSRRVTTARKLARPLQAKMLTRKLARVVQAKAIV